MRNGGGSCTRLPPLLREHPIYGFIVGETVREWGAVPENNEEKRGAQDRAEDAGGPAPVKDNCAAVGGSAALRMRRPLYGGCAAVGGSAALRMRRPLYGGCAAVPFPNRWIFLSIFENCARHQSLQLPASASRIEESDAIGRKGKPCAAKHGAGIGGVNTGLNPLSICFVL